MRSPRYWRITAPHKILLLLIGSLWLAGRANAQAVRFDSVADTTSAQCANSGKQCNILSLPGTQVNFCSGANAGVVNTSGKMVTWVSGQLFSTSWTGQISINGTSQQIASVTSTTSLTTVASLGTLTSVTYSSLSACLASPATTYTDFSAGTTCGTTSQLTPATGGACLSTANNQGEFGGWFLPGQYSYYLRVPATAGGGTYGPYPINIGASAGCPLGALTCDANYATLALACAAAGSGTLAVTKSWNATPTQSIACGLEFFGLGKIVMATNAVLTVTNTILAPPGQQIFDISASGSSVDLTGAKLNSMLPAPWFGVKCDGATSNARTIAGAQAAMGTNSFINFPNGDCLTPQLRPYSGQMLVGAGGSSQFVSGQTTFTYTGSAGTPMITNATGTAIKNFFILGIALDGVALADPVVNWYNMSDGGIEGSVFSCSRSGCNALVVDSGSGTAYRNTFRGNKCDGVLGACITLQNGANGNFIEHNFMINQTATVATYGIKALSSSANNVITANDIESFTTSPSGPVTGTGIYLDAAQNVLAPGGRIEEVLNGVVMTANGSGTTINCGNYFTTSVTNPLTIDPTVDRTGTICYKEPGTGNTKNYSGWFHQDVTSFSGGSTSVNTLYPQTATSNLAHQWDYGMNTSGTHRFEYYSNTTRTAYVDMKAGAWVGTGNLYGQNYATVLGASGDTASAAAWMNVYGYAMNVRSGSTSTTIDIDPVLQNGNAITSSTLNAGGSGYAVNDTGVIVGPASIAGTYTVNTVNGSGAVLTYTISSAGTGYIVRDGYLTAPAGGQPGKGSGFAINVTGVAASTGSGIINLFGNMTSSGSRTFRIYGLPASAGAGGVFLCIDNANRVYAKATCP